MMRWISTAAAALTMAGSILWSAAPASAVELCDPNRFVCVYVLDPRDGCPGGYAQIARVPLPGGGVILLVCVLQ